MRFLGQRLQAIGPLRDVTVDWEAMPGLIVAVCGDNGEGKSTLLESIPGGFYRKCPTRGSMADLASSKEAFVENRIVNGAAWTVRLWPGRGEAEVLDAAGKSVLGDRKVTTLDEWARKALPPPELLYSSIISPQPLAKSKWAGGFLGRTAGDRKEVLLRALGCERLERMAEAARQRAAGAKTRYELASTRLADERARGVDLAEAEKAAAGAGSEVEEVEGRARVADAELAVVREQAAAVTACNADRERMLAARAASQAAADAASVRVNTLVSRAVELRGLLEEADHVRAEAKAHADLGRQIATLREEHAGALAKHRGVALAYQAAVEGEEAAAAARSRADDRVSSIEAGLARLPRPSGFSVPHAEEQAHDAEASLEHLRAAEAALAAQWTERVEGRAASLRTAVDSIASIDRYEDCSEAKPIARAAAKADDDTLALAQKLPAEREQASAAVRAAIERVKLARKALDDAKRAQKQLDAVEAAERILAEARVALENATSELHGKHEAAKAAREAVTGSLGAHQTLAARIEDLAREAAKLEPAVARSREIDAASASLAEVTTQLSFAKAQEWAARETIPAGEPPPAEKLPDVAAAEKVARDTAAHVAHARAKLASAEKDLERARASAARVTQLYTDTQAAEVDLADWTRLGDDLGRDGLQAAEIDAACPELTAIVNDLLHHCVGPRWTVTFATQRQGDKKLVEGCDVRVLDTVRGRDALAETLSGGEAVIVGEAVSLGLSVLACRRWGVERPTLVRDESGASLDPSNAAAYVAMLRRAAAQIGASKVLLVSHSREVVELADTRVMVANGEVRIAA